MIKLSEHFMASEFVCRCGVCEYSDPDIIPHIIDKALVAQLQELRYAINVPIGISRGVSCENHHKAIYKARYGDQWEKHYTPGSAHLCINGKFHGADTYPKIKDFQVYRDLAIWFRFYGVILYMKNIGGIYVSNFVHVDTIKRNEHPHIYFVTKYYT